MAAVLITGCRSGFGFALARRLAAAGRAVVATDPEIDGLEARLRAGLPEGAPLTVLSLDVRDEASVTAAVAAAGPIDALVNNGGYAIFAAQAEVDLDAIREMFEVNVIGLARVTRAFLPQIRAAGGTIVQLSSVASEVVFPESGFYAATKWAVEAMSEALFQENARFGVKVRLIRPGSFDTCFIDTAQRLSPPRDPASPYAEERARWDDRKRSLLASPQQPELVAAAIADALDRPEPFLRIPVGEDSARLIDARREAGTEAWLNWAL